MSSIKLFDRNGNMLAELEATCTRSWLLSDVGKANFTLSTRDPKCKREYLEFGNLVYIEHEKLPAWGGVIDTPRKWGAGTVTIQVYSAEKLLDYRISSLNNTLKGNGGMILKQIIGIAQSEELFPITVGEIYDGGKTRKETLNLAVLLDKCQEIIDKAGGDFLFTPFLLDNKLQFEFSYSLSAGIDTELALIEGQNLKLSTSPLTEKGTICNDITGYGDGSSWSSRPTYRATDEESIAQYGRRQEGKNFSGDSEDNTLEENTEQRLVNKAYPSQVLDLNVLDVGDTWKWMRLGNTFPVMLYSVGFMGNGFGYKGTATVHGMEFDENEQTVRVVFDSVEGEE